MTICKKTFEGDFATHSKRENQPRSQGPILLVTRLRKNMQLLLCTEKHAAGQTWEHMQPQCHAPMCSWYKARENMQILSRFLREKVLGTNQREKCLVPVERARAHKKYNYLYPTWEKARDPRMHLTKIYMFYFFSLGGVRSSEDPIRKDHAPHIEKGCC